MLIHDGHVSTQRFFTSDNARSYDSLVRLATFGRDFAWKRQILDAIGNRNVVLELACGTGIFSTMLARSNKTVCGIDLTLEYLQILKSKMEIPTAQGTAEILPFRRESFDAVVSSYVAKYVDIARTVQECWRVLNHGGVAVFHDFIYPQGLMRALWNLYFRILKIAGNFVSSWKVVFGELDDIIRKSDWVRQTSNALYAAGFQNVSCKFYTASTAAILLAEKP